MRQLDHILSNAAINAVILAGVLLSKTFEFVGTHSYLWAAVSLFAVALCVRDLIKALTYKY